MYLIKFKSIKKREDILVEGNFPSELIDSLILEENEDIIIISHYSNTIKVPFIIEENGVKYCEFLEYKL